MPSARYFWYASDFPSAPTKRHQSSFSISPTSRSFELDIRTVSRLMKSHSSSVGICSWVANANRNEIDL